MNNCNEINVFSKILEKFSMKDNEANNNMIQNINFFEEKQADYDQKRGLVTSHT